MTLPRRWRRHRCKPVIAGLRPEVGDADFPVLKQILLEAGVSKWKDNTSEGESLYILDPDGHKLEVHAGDLESRLESLRSRPYDGLEIF